MSPIRRLTTFALAATCATCAWWGLAATQPAQAADYPSKPITVIVPYAPGGITDGLGRQVSQFLSKHFNQTAVVDNKPGAGASIGGRLLVTAKPDGYTLGVFDPTGITITPQLYDKPPYDSVKGFTPITRLGNNYQILVAHPSSPVNTVADLVALAKQQGAIPIATPAPFNQLDFARLSDAAGISFTNVAYKGSSPMLQDVVAGQVPLAYLDVASAFSYVSAGKVKPIAVSAKQRLDLLPKVPTIAEVGFPDYESVAWFGVFAPAGTPKEVVQQLDAALQVFGRSKEYAAWARDRSFFPSVSASPEDYAKNMRTEVERYRSLAKRLNIRLD